MDRAEVDVAIRVTLPTGSARAAKDEDKPVGAKVWCEHAAAAKDVSRLGGIRGSRVVRPLLRLEIELQAADEAVHRVTRRRPPG